MRFFTSSFADDEGILKGLALHAVDDTKEELYTYVRELKTWNLDRGSASDFYFPELNEQRVEFVEVSRAEVYGLLDRVPFMDRSDDAMRRVSDRQRSQLGVPGQVLTSKDVGITADCLAESVDPNSE